MDVDPLNDSVTHINLSAILNKSIQPEGQKETPVDETDTNGSFYWRGKRLKAALTIIAKASHHKAFMETCLMRNMSLWVQPHIHHSNPDVEKQWKDTLHQASLNLTTTFIQHYMKIIKRPNNDWISHTTVKKKLKRGLETLATAWKKIERQSYSTNWNVLTANRT